MAASDFIADTPWYYCQSRTHLYSTSMECGKQGGVQG